MSSPCPPPATPRADATARLVAAERDARAWHREAIRLQARVAELEARERQWSAERDHLVRTYVDVARDYAHVTQQWLQATALLVAHSPPAVLTRQIVGLFVG